LPEGNLALRHGACHRIPPLMNPRKKKQTLTPEEISLPPSFEEKWLPLLTGWTHRARKIGWGKEQDSLPARAVKIGLLTGLAIRQNQLFFHAAALSFYSSLAIIPILALVLALLKGFGLAQMLQPVLLGTLAAGHQELSEKLTESVQAAQTATLGGVGVVSLLVTGFLALQRVRNSLNQIWEVWVRGKYKQRLLEYIAVLFVTPLLLVMTFSAATYLKSFQDSPLGPIPFFSDFGFFMLSNSGFPVFLVMLLYAYLFLPETRVEVFPALLGSLVAAAFIYWIEMFYISLMVHLTTYQSIYGPMILLPILLVWMFLGWVIFLCGAQLSWVVQNYSLLAGRLSLRSGHDIRPYLALRLLAGVIIRFEDGGKPVGAKPLAKALGIPLGMTQDILQAMVKGRLLVAIPDLKNHYVPRRPKDHLTVAEALARLDILPGFAEGAQLLPPSSSPSVQSLLEQANLSLNTPLRRITLHQLVEQIRLESPL